MKLIKVLAISSMIAGMAFQANAQLDTAGISNWKTMNNSTATWEEGAFGANAGDFPNYGWGNYNMISHNVTGDSLFVIKNLDGSYKKLWIREKKSVANRYVFWYADLDGTNEIKMDLSINDYASKLFVNYSLSGDSVVNTQPPSDSWDLVLTRFYKYFPGFGNYPVTGFLANDNVGISVYNAPDSATAAAATIADTTEFTDSIAAIGNGWYKTNAMFQIVPLDTIVYFIRVSDGEIYKMQTTYFESGSGEGKGRVGIRKQKLTGIAQTEFVYDTLVIGNGYVNDVYFSMSQGTKNQAKRANWEIGFKTEQFSSSIWANTISGVELYTYPNGDTSAWNPSTSIAPMRAETGQMNLYPVPASGMININYSFDTQLPLNISVYDLTGKLVLERKMEQSATKDIQFDITPLRPGMYMLQIGNNEIRAVRKFTVR